MKRREFLGAWPAILPCGARAQDRSSMRVVGYLSRGATSEALARALAERGYVEGRNLRIDIRQASRDESEQPARRPGGNITGLSLGVPEMSEVIVGLMRSLQPGIRRIAVFVSKGQGAIEAWTVLLRSLEAVARAMGIAWELVPVDSLAAFEKALTGLDPRTSTAYLCCG